MGPRRKVRSPHKQNRRSRQEASPQDGDVETGEQDTWGGSGNGSGSTPPYYLLKQDEPLPTAAWQAAGSIAISCAFAALMGALTAGKEAILQPLELLILAGMLAFVSLVCFIAHWTTNQGRWTKRTKVRKVPLGEERD